jgi:hypothetical protein
MLVMITAENVIMMSPLEFNPETMQDLGIGLSVGIRARWWKKETSARFFVCFRLVVDSGDEKGDGASPSSKSLSSENGARLFNNWGAVARR